MRRFLSTMAVVALAAGVACTEGTSPNAQMARVTIQLTDGFGDFSAATVEIGAVVLIPADGPPITVTDNAGSFNLLDLQNGVTATLATLDVPAGQYLQLRLIVNGAEVTLADGMAFRDGSTSKTLKVPSGAQSGIKVLLFDEDDFGHDESMGTENSEERDGVTLGSGETIIVLDFDVARNFVLTGPKWEPTGVLFKPVIRAVVRDVAGSIAGTVTNAADASPAVGATVRATLLDSPVLPELQTAEATAVTDDAGAYKIWYLSPGTYEVSVDGSTVTPVTVTVGANEAITDVDFQLPS